MRPLVIACDFDGTITERDTLHVIVERFAERGVWDAIEPRLRSGELTLEEAMERQFAAVCAGPEEVRDLVEAEAPIRAGFHELVRFARAGGHRLVVLSSGFASVIAEVLERAGLGELDVASHEAEFSADGCRLVWSDRGEPCAACGRRCKRHDLASRWHGEPLVYVGDGISDVCAARQADLVFARGHLARDLEAAGLPFRPFGDFFDVLAGLRAPGALAA